MIKIAAILLLTILLSCQKEPLQDCDCGTLIDTYEFIDSKNWQGWIWQSDCGAIDSTFYYRYPGTDHETAVNGDGGAIDSTLWYIGKRICKLKQL